MVRGTLRAGIALAVLVGAGACKGPAVPHPMQNESRWLCCNLHYEKPKVSDVNFQRGTLVPFGTRVQILEVRSNSVTFQPEGHPPITWQVRYAKGTPIDQTLERLFLAADPRARLRRVPAKTVKLIEQGAVDVGMTREQVLMALGYPPAHRTPSLDAAQWTYWDDRWTTFEVYFDGDKVARVSR